ncbi:MAG: lipid A biosynthesis acyltransferase [Xanthomarina sp.]|uniref:Lipid A biosynthesis acyltransferase n=1 Tax=Xanthomarina gelatinilytica TaxID=1137281 RepID=A0A3C0F6J0_9FLAO|nr:lipid A biosynthesis acyltransferase [Xanthomarina sp.]MAL21792.1 lipid A biosynthesis acyltransferase [Xanthomarina sp.]MBF62147.1 lipid A biosynthesis acyltransferase [Xanthomarina sp.]HAI19132.1 lipid A biosynthesis acyltransferase [Xanthomarina gelatinilytica]HCY82400.1 lipid A biosynthesis acyltransferase [Xanthomarina gelatinilytica]|tara:strand:- start:1521 stop:2402 length:882 start_codon:yes stop_codon:yes gene_type:complete
MAAEWQGKSRGTVLGYKIFVFFMKKVGIGAAYFILYFVAAYFCFFSKDSTKSIYYYLRHRLKYSKLKSVFGIFKSYYVFGQTILDKIAISSGLSDRFTYESDGVHFINETLKAKKGGVLISAHVGNFEISEHFFGVLEENASISLLTTDVEHTAIKEYLDSVRKKSNIKLILIKEDLSHIFEVNAALARNEIVCITGDRYVKGSKFLTEELLGKEAKFPAGPFMLASRLNVPVLFVYVMKETNKHYHLYARKSQAKHRDAQALLKEYTQSVTWMLKKHPLQWFNYFDFWNALK